MLRPAAGGRGKNRRARRVLLPGVALLLGLLGPIEAAWSDQGPGGGGHSGSSGSGSSGSGGGGSDNSGSGSSGSGSSGSSGTSGSGSSGKGSEGSSGGNSGPSGQSRGESGDDAERGSPASNRQERVYEGGWKERIRNGRYQIFDPEGRRVIDRKAQPADAARINQAATR